MNMIPCFRRTRMAVPVLAATLSLMSLGCDHQSPSAPGTPSAQVTLNASGATFPAPLYQRWFAEYNKLHPEVQVNYQGVGSGAGIKSFTDGLTDFGASDAAMSDAEIAAVKTGGVILLPMTAGSIVISYNLPGIAERLRLPRDVYPAIFLGDVKVWNDPKIAAANPGVNLPDMAITVASRADGSGTTYNFSGHLSAINPDFKSKIGQGKQVKFPGVAGKGNDGVAALIKQTPGTIGYVEYGYAQQTKLPMATLENQAGKYVEPTPESGSAALAQVPLPDNLRAFITDPAGDTSYPIVTYTWWLVHSDYTKPEVAAAIKPLADWCLTDGQKLSAGLGYLPMPDNVVTKVQAAVTRIK
jgi:phosphate transport system substrate-binding protein